jgi:hypothetical protein
MSLFSGSRPRPLSRRKRRKIKRPVPSKKMSVMRKDDLFIFSLADIARMAHLHITMYGEKHSHYNDGNNDNESD